MLLSRSLSRGSNLARSSYTPTPALSLFHSLLLTRSFSFSFSFSSPFSLFLYAMTEPSLLVHAHSRPVARLRPLCACRSLPPANFLPPGNFYFLCLLRLKHLKYYAISSASFHLPAHTRLRASVSAARAHSHTHTQLRLSCSFSTRDSC